MIKKTHNIYSLKYVSANSSSIIRYGRFGIKVTSFGRLTETQLNSLNRFITSSLKKNTNNKKNIKVWNFVMFNIALTKLNSESRMGKGKGSIYSKAVFLKPGTIILEFSGISRQHAMKLFCLVKKKISFKISLIERF